MAKEMSNNDIAAYEGGDYGEIMDNYDLHEITAAIANRAGKAADTVRSLEQEIEEMKNNPDVVDVVATYADLQDYDTSQLTDKDVIRVLQDETHNDESTYYRWSATAQSWTYIGESKQYTDFVGTDGTTAGTNGLVPAPATTDAGKFLKADGTWDDAGSAVNVVQTTGTSTTDVMSQNAVTSMVFNDPSSLTQIKIGDSAISTATRGIAIGYSTQSTGNRAIAIGANANANGSGISTGNMAIGYNSETTSRGGVALGGASHATANYTVAVGCSSQAQKINSTALGYQSNANGNYSLSLGDTATTSADGAIAIGRNATAATAGSIALGAASSSARKGEMNIGVASGSENTYGYNNSQYRLLTGLYNPQTAHDAATKGYVDSIAVGTDESYTIATSDWTALSASTPYTYQATVTATSTIGANSTVELINDNAVLFGTYGFAIGSVDTVNNQITIYSVGQPSASVTLTVNIKG